MAKECTFFVGSWNSPRQAVIRTTSVCTTPKRTYWKARLWPQNWPRSLQNIPDSDFVQDLYMWNFKKGCLVAELCSTLLFHGPPCSSVHRIFQARLLQCAVYFLLREIFRTQRVNPCLLHWQVDSLPLSHQGRIGEQNWLKLSVTYALTPSNSPGKWEKYILDQENQSYCQKVHGLPWW